MQEPLPHSSAPQAATQIVHIDTPDLRQWNHGFQRRRKCIRAGALIAATVVLLLVAGGVAVSLALDASRSPSAPAAGEFQQPLQLCSSPDNRDPHGCASDHHGVLDVTLELRSHDFEGPGFAVWTRAFNDSVPAPTLRVRRGDILRILIINSLGANPDAPATYAKVNTTNLHFHGFHGSPRCGDDPSRPDVCSDDVLNVEIPPGERRQYEYHIGEDHAPGLFWYHPHAEGSTAVQVGQGAAGAIIIEDEPERVPSWLLAMDEKILVLQEVFFREDCHFDGPNRIRFPGCPAMPQLERLAHGSLSHVRQSDPNATLWYFTINGQHRPKMRLEAGVWQRWRMLMAGSNSNLRIELPGCEIQLLAKDGIFVSPMPRDLRVPNFTLPDMAAAAREECVCRAEWTSRSDGGHCNITQRGCTPACDGGPYDAWCLVANAGCKDDEGGGWAYCDLNSTTQPAPERPQPAPRKPAPASIFLSPANRAEVAVRCPAGNYTLGSEAAEGGPGKGLPGQPLYPGIDGAFGPLADVIVEPATTPSPAVELTPTTPWRPAYLRDLTDLPSSNISENLVVALINNGPRDLTLNGKRFGGFVDPANSSTYLNKMKIGTVQEWRIQPSGTHPFHMHVNPMQLHSFPASSNYGNWWEVGDFHDVVRLPWGGGATRVRFYIDRYPGNIVLHCHILRHEDLGLMAASIAEW